MLFLSIVINQIYMNGDMSTMLLIISIVGKGLCFWEVIKGYVMYIDDDEDEVETIVLLLSFISLVCLRSLKSH